MVCAMVLLVSMCVVAELTTLVTSLLVSPSSSIQCRNAMHLGSSSLVDEGSTLSPLQTELPADFLDAANRCAKYTLDCIKAGSNRCRIDFDTSVGDMTYTSIKNTMPLLKQLVRSFSMEMELSLSAPTNKEVTSPEVESDNQSTSKDFKLEKSLRIFYPDMGAAALTRRDWKLGTALSEVSPCVLTANIQNDELQPTDKLAIILCPQYSETDFVSKIVDMCTQQNVPCVMINPALINMDQGFGVRARNIRKGLLDTFTMTYKLKTLSKGAIVREWPRGYTLWYEDVTAEKEGGYRALQTFHSEPSRETIEELFDMMDPELRAKTEKRSAVAGAVGEVVGFFKGLSRM